MPGRQEKRLKQCLYIATSFTPDINKLMQDNKFEVKVYFVEINACSTLKTFSLYLFSDCNVVIKLCRPNPYFTKCITVKFTVII